MVECSVLCFVCHYFSTFSLSAWKLGWHCARCVLGDNDEYGWRRYENLGTRLEVLCRNHPSMSPWTHYSQSRHFDAATQETRTSVRKNMLYCRLCHSIFSLTLSTFYSTVSVECCYQNVGIATSVALTMFEGDELAEALGVPFFYGVVEAVILGVYCIGAWKLGWTKAPRNAPIWKVLSTSYEVICAEEKELDEIEIKISDSDDAMEDELSDDGNILTTYFYMGSLEPDKPKEPSGLVVTESTKDAPILKDNEP